jgi:AcrR family transcriptional regulator/DNA-binding MarR family transcriptional regulator
VSAVSVHGAAREGDAPRSSAAAGLRTRSGASADRESGLAPGQVTDIQRSRLLAAAVRAVEELGYTRATVAHITRRARVSRRTFYELFANREECMAALLESVVSDISEEIAGAGLAGLPWRERMRRGLAAILAFLDREPALARVCVVQSARGGQGVLERREEILSRLAVAVDEGRSESARGGQCPPLTAEGLVGAGFTIVYARLLRGEPQELTELLGELMGMIVLPYLGAAAARREQALSARAPAVSMSGRVAAGSARARRDPLEDIPMRLTYRTARVLDTIAEQSGISNREAGERAGILDQGQISKLLARLERLGLIENGADGHAKGEPNAWTLTVTGREVAQSIRGHARHEGERRVA